MVAIEEQGAAIASGHGVLALSAVPPTSDLGGSACDIEAALRSVSADESRAFDLDAAASDRVSSSRCPLARLLEWGKLKDARKSREHSGRFAHLYTGRHVSPV